MVLNISGLDNPRTHSLQKLVAHYNIHKGLLIILDLGPAAVHGVLRATEQGTAYVMIHDHDHHNLPPHQSDEPLNQGHQPLLGNPVTVCKTQDSPGCLEE